ncbi:MAG: hypothetical protein IPI34_12770 [bacterium]|nr:hypothetical protein [bacterium]
MTASCPTSRPSSAGVRSARLKRRPSPPGRRPARRPWCWKALAAPARPEEAVRLLAALLDEGTDHRQIVVIAPGTAAAARFHLSWRRLRPGLPLLNVALESDGLELGDPPGDGILSGEPGEEVLVLLEAQDLPTALRFRAAQRFQAGRQLWTVDPMLCQETREHLYLVVPPRQQVIALREQRDQSRQVCEEILDLVARFAGERPRVRARRRERGEVVSSYTTNGPEAVSLIVEQQRAVRGVSGTWSRRCAAISSRSHRARRSPAGSRWSATAWTPLLLPGPLKCWPWPWTWPRAADQPARRGAAPAPESAPAAAGLLTARSSLEYGRWLAESAPPPTATLSELIAAVARTGWSEALLAWPVVRAD